MKKLLLLFVLVTGMAFTAETTVYKYLGFGILSGGTPSACIGFRAHNSDAITDVAVMLNSTGLCYELCFGVKGLYDFETCYAGAGLVASYTKTNKEYHYLVDDCVKHTLSPVFTVGKDMGKYFSEISLFVPHFHRHDTSKYPTMQLLCGLKF